MMTKEKRDRIRKGYRGEVGSDMMSCLDDLDEQDEAAKRLAKTGREMAFMQQDRIVANEKRIAELEAGIRGGIATIQKAENRIAKMQSQIGELLNAEKHG